MNLSQIDLNLLVYFDVLLREKNVTRSAEILSITQPAMSNGLRRLRNLFDDPLLVRTGDRMSATERAIELQPKVREILEKIESSVKPPDDFNASASKRIFRIMASDYAESTLVPNLLDKLALLAPNISLDILTPSDGSFEDLEMGRVDIAINRFNYLPNGFHQTVLWRDGFSCLMRHDNPILANFDLDAYLLAPHIWVSKTGLGIGRGVNPNDAQKLGWVDEALAEIGKNRRIRVFTRHYQVASLLARSRDLIATLPTQAAKLNTNDPSLAIRKPPFMIIPFELKMAWSPLLHHDGGHVWLRRCISDMAQEIQNT